MRLHHVVAASIKFEQSSYSVNEGNGPVQPVLILTNPSSTSITVNILSFNGTATGMYSLVIL